MRTISAREAARASPNPLTLRVNCSAMLRAKASGAVLPRPPPHPAKQFQSLPSTFTPELGGWSSWHGHRPTAPLAEAGQMIGRPRRRPLERSLGVSVRGFARVKMVPNWTPSDRMWVQSRPRHVDFAVICIIIKKSVRIRYPCSPHSRRS
jgi:hypothetical protein